MSSPVQLTIAICKKIRDNQEGEVWEEKGRIKIDLSADIQRLMDFKNGKIPSPGKSVPLCDYKDLLVFLDANGNPLFGVAEKNCADWIRISDCHPNGVGLFFIGGDQDYDSLRYVQEVETTRGIRAKFGDD